jgi:cell division protein FtsX
LKVKPLEFVPGSTPDPESSKYPKSEIPVKDANGKETQDAQGKVITKAELTPEGQAMYENDLAPFIQSTAQRIREVVKDRLDRQELADIEAAVAQSGGSTGFSNRTVWLIIVSFLVCVVGIANAMLMSVTERFREIATMKCLGATDNFIMINFILESIMQGVAGGILGSILGFLLGSLRAWASYGNMAWQNFPLGQVLATAGTAMVVGVVVSALAAMYPAYVAARLAPMEAMRIE